jgi:ribonuclease D
MIFPSDITKEQVNGLPLKEYRGKIQIVDNISGLKKAVKMLDHYPYIGFDTETKPAFRKGVYHQVSLLQLAVNDMVFLVRLNKLGFPDILHELFIKRDQLKVGISIRDDLVELKKLADFNPDGIVELNEVAKDLGVVRQGARNLTATFLGFRISKSQQTSNWENERLSQKQQRYAATDAWVCYRIYHKLIKQGFLGQL